jgi:hypothetical protein
MWSERVHPKTATMLVLFPCSLFLSYLLPLALIFEGRVAKGPQTKLHIAFIQGNIVEESHYSFNCSFFFHGVVFDSTCLFFRILSRQHSQLTSKKLIHMHDCAEGLQGASFVRFEVLFSSWAS